MNREQYPVDTPGSHLLFRVYHPDDGTLPGREKIDPGSD